MTAGAIFTRTRTTPRGNESKCKQVHELAKDKLFYDRENLNIRNIYSRHNQDGSTSLAIKVADKKYAQKLSKIFKDANIGNRIVEYSPDCEITHSVSVIINSASKAQSALEELVQKKELDQSQLVTLTLKSLDPGPYLGPSHY